jgi:1,4-alpha-glucan branching enzyme
MANSKNGYKTITFRLYAPEAQNISIAGTFNDWNVSSHPMKRSRKGKNGYVYWQLPMRLLPGTYQYLFFVDGQWWNDPASNQYMPNEFGSMNNVVEIEE